MWSDKGGIYVELGLAVVPSWLQRLPYLDRTMIAPTNVHGPSFIIIRFTCSSFIHPRFTLILVLLVSLNKSSFN